MAGMLFQMEYGDWVEQKDLLKGYLEMISSRRKVWVHMFLQGRKWRAERHWSFNVSRKKHSYTKEILWSLGNETFQS